jgi:hypothetical protein
MNRPRLARALRITWTAFWGIACVLLCVLWVRSYGQDEHILWNSPKSCFGTSIYPGEVTLEHVNDGVFMPMGWSHVVFPHGDDEDYHKTTLGFAWQTDDDQITAFIPFWFLALTCAAFALFAMMPLPTFRRFSLRTLLIAITLTALGFGIIVWLILGPSKVENKKINDAKDTEEIAILYTMHETDVPREQLAAEIVSHDDDWVVRVKEVPGMPGAFWRLTIDASGEVLDFDGGL